MKKVSLLLAFVALVSAGFAQNAPSTGALAEQAPVDTQVAMLGTDVCQSTFTSGNGISYMKFCVTQNGNVSKFESPSTFDQLHEGGEGYGLCDVTNGNVGYYDWGIYGDSGWQNPTITQPNGPNTFPLTITRNSTDGNWTLKQVFSRNAGTPAVKVTMTLKNNSAVTRKVFMERFADIDADGANAGNFFDADQFGAWAHSLHGLMMRALTIDGLSLGGRIVPPGTTDPCNNSIINAPYKGDAAALLLWAFYGSASIAPQNSKTALFEYRAF